MIKVHLETDSLKAPAEAIHRALRKTVYALNKKIKRELKDDMSSSLNIKRPWVLKGFRSSVESESKNLVTATIHHRDAYLNKQEKGATLTAHKNNILIPLGELREVKRNYRSRARWLMTDKKTFADETGVWRRYGRNRKLIGIFKRSTSYKPKTNLEKRATETTEREANLLFRNYLKGDFYQ